MARPLRIEYEGAFYHVTARGNEKRKIFFSRKDYEKFKEYLAEAREKYRFRLHAYVLMTNHYHLLIETPEKNLSRLMHYINSSYTTYTNVKRKRSGHLFQGRYKAIVIDRDSYLLELSRYIHLNPVRVNMAGNPEEYPYSSYVSYISDHAEALVTRSTILEMFNKRESEARKRYKSFVESAVDDEKESPMTKVYAGMILGGEGFIRDILEKIEEGRLQKEAVSHRKALSTSVGLETVLSAVCKYYGMSGKEIIDPEHGESRKMCMYLMKKQTVATTREICELLGGMSYAAAAKMYQRFTQELARNKVLRGKVEGIRKTLSHFEG